MYELRIERSFLASHGLRLYDGSREPLHAHDWRVEVEVQAQELDSIELAIDFHELERIVGAALDALRGANLNEHPAFLAVNPSAERVAQHIFEVVAERLPPRVTLSAVTVTEALGCRASYRMAR